MRSDETAGLGIVCRGGVFACDPARRASADNPVSITRSGFTLIELIFVLIIAGILVGLAAPRFNSATFRIRGSTQRIGTTLLAAQRAAVKMQHNVVVALDTVNGTLRVHRDSDNDFAIEQGERVRTIGLGDGIVFGRGGIPAHPLVGAGAASLDYAQGGLPALVFKRGGSAREEAGFYITTTRAADTGDYPEEVRGFHIARASGRPSWFRYVNGSWTRGF